jgi:hypothetical protein
MLTIAPARTASRTLFGGAQLCFHSIRRKPLIGNARETARKGKGTGPAAAGAMKMAPQALGKIESGDGNGAVGVRRMSHEGLRDRSDEKTKGHVLMHG